MKLFALHPGYVTSKTDGKPQYVSPGTLADLYKIPYTKWAVWDDRFPNTHKFRNPDSYIHLYPRQDGNYECPKPST